MKANYGVFCPLVNLTTINRQTNVAFISIRLAVTFVYTMAGTGFERLNAREDE